MAFFFIILVPGAVVLTTVGLSVISLGLIDVQAALAALPVTHGCTSTSHPTTDITGNGTGLAGRIDCALFEEGLSEGTHALMERNCLLSLDGAELGRCT